MNHSKNYTENNKITTDYVTNKMREYVGASIHRMNPEAQEHVVNIGVSILETKWAEIGPGYGGGGFVNAIINNDLMESFGRADNINKDFIEFYVKLLYNFSPSNLNYKK